MTNLRQDKVTNLTDPLFESAYGQRPQGVG